MKLTGNATQDIELVRALAHNMYPDNKIMEDLCLCQAIQESDLRNDGSVLSNKYNNLFGIKYPSSSKNVAVVKSLGGKPVNMSTIEYTDTRIKADFVAFPNLESCIKYRDYMLSWSLYSGVKKASTFEEACKEIAKHWATDPSYIKALMTLYKKYCN